MTQFDHSTNPRSKLARVNDPELRCVVLQQSGAGCANSARPETTDDMRASTARLMLYPASLGDSPVMP